MVQGLRRFFGVFQAQIGEQNMIASADAAGNRHRNRARAEYDRYLWFHFLFPSVVEEIQTTPP